MAQYEIESELTKHFADVTIVGAGPAGSTAAYLIAQTGLKVILIDKCIFPRDKLCGGGLTTKTIDLLRRIYNDTSESLRTAGIIDTSTDTLHFFCKSKKLSSITTINPLHCVKRIVYDKYLLDKAILTGATLFSGEEVIEINTELSKVYTAKKVIKSRYIIGADGVYSNVRKELIKQGMINQQQWDKGVKLTLETFVPAEKLPAYANNNIYIYFGLAKSSYAWIFPGKNELTIGICTMSKSHNKRLSANFNNFLNTLNMDDIALHESKKNTKGCMIPCGNFLANPAYKNTILIGDAAGLTHPLTGEGIFYAQRSAELAALAIIKNYKQPDRLREMYVKNLKNCIISTFKHAKKIEPIFFSLANSYYLLKPMFSSMIKKYRKNKCRE